jgi:hypothetical protein
VRHRDFDTGEQLPAGWLDSLQEFLSTAAHNFKIEQVNATTLRVPGGAGSAKVSIGIPAAAGGWRFNEANATAAAPANAGGEYPIYVTSRANDEAAEDAGTFDYSFGLKLATAPTGAGAEAISRQVGTYLWNGAAITHIRQTVPPGVASGAESDKAFAFFMG